MNRHLISVTGSGVILLGNEVSCDGFHREYPVRIQTHIHHDHMINFETSKGKQDIYLTNETLQLLIADHNADLPIRSNLKPISCGDQFLINSSLVTFFTANHMLGAVQVAVELPEGIRLGYSGDFQWPLDKVIEVDQLVLDSTYGSPKSIRRYTQGEADYCLLQTVIEKLRFGPIHIKSHRGTIQRGLQALSEIENCVFLASDKLCREIQVYREFGYSIGPVISINSPEGKSALQTNRYIRVFGKGDQLPLQMNPVTTITLSAYRTQPDSPIMEFSDRFYGIALSNHADFEGTLEYVQATGAKFVVTDNSRGGHAVELAIEIHKRLGIEAIPSEAEISKEWGG